MNCQEIRERLPALIDSELEPAELEEVEKHLAQCPECQKEKVRQEKFTTSVKISLEGLKPSDRFVKQVIAKLPEGDAQARAEQAAASRRKAAVSLVVALIIIVLAIAIAAIHAARRKWDQTPKQEPKPGAAGPEAPR